MEIEKLVYLALTASAELLALCPADKIYPDGEIQNVSLPTIKHRMVADRSFYTHSGRVTLRQADFYQVACYAATLASARAIAEKVIDALSGFNLVGSPASGLHGFHINSNTLPYDEDVRAVGIELDFEFWYGN